MNIAVRLGLATLAAAALAAALLALSGNPAATVSAQSATPTWRRQIAPILYKNCTSCHHEGGSGPFSLTSYPQAKRWASVMQTVTQSHVMPPWLPEPGFGAFAGDRRLSDEDIALIRAWVESGTPEGSDPALKPPMYAADWELGPPDIILEMTTPLPVPAGGADLFENIVLPVPLQSTHWVRAMEIKPGSPQVVHHANVILDPTASLRRAHPSDWQHGIPGMDILVDSGNSFDPDSHFLFWKPDSTALVEPPGMPWKLDPGTDLVLNLHLKPTGKPESVRARIGLYFTPNPATEHPMLLQLEHDAALDIPAGQSAFVVEDTLRLPVRVDVLGIYPHAHYLGKKMEAWATLPSGDRRWLILIKDWDIDRQAVYRFAKPVPLPLGTVVHMRYTYDNSAHNVRNPNSPPIRVRAGNRSVDEMGHLWLQVLPHPEPASDAPTSDPRLKLERAWMENRLRKDPGDDIALYNLASLFTTEGDNAQAIQLYRRALAKRPGNARTITSLGTALEASGDWQGAQSQYRAAILREPQYTDAIFNLAALDLRHGSLPEAEQLFRDLVAAHPGDAGARAGLGSVLLASERPADARSEFEAALAAAPDNYDALLGLAQIHASSGDLKIAEPLLLRAIAVRNDAEPQRLLAMVYAGTGKMDLALVHLLAWQRLQPSDAEPHRALAQVYSQLGRLSDALREQTQVVTLAPGSTADWNDLGVLEAQSGDKLAARRALEHALALDPENKAAKANLQRL